MASLEILSPVANVVEQSVKPAGEPVTMPVEE